MQDWDPIGVKDEPAAQDEYDVYVARIVQMLKQNASAEALYRYLREVETEAIGLPGDRTKTRYAADRLSALRDNGDLPHGY
jgi:fatty acid-binding protein DegV